MRSFCWNQHHLFDGFHGALVHRIPFLHQILRIIICGGTVDQDLIEHSMIQLVLLGLGKTSHSSSCWVARFVEECKECHKKKTGLNLSQILCCGVLANIQFYIFSLAVTEHRVPILLFLWHLQFGTQSHKNHRWNSGVDGHCNYRSPTDMPVNRDDGCSTCHWCSTHHPNSAPNFPAVRSSRCSHVFPKTSVVPKH